MPGVLMVVREDAEEVRLLDLSSSDAAGKVALVLGAPVLLAIAWQLPRLWGARSMGELLLLQGAFFVAVGFPILAVRRMYLVDSTAGLYGWLARRLAARSGEGCERAVRRTPGGAEVDGVAVAGPLTLRLEARERTTEGGASIRHTLVLVGGEEERTLAADGSYSAARGVGRRVARMLGCAFDDRVADRRTEAADLDTPLRGRALEEPGPPPEALRTRVRIRPRGDRLRISVSWGSDSIGCLVVLLPLWAGTLYGVFAQPSGMDRALMLGLSTVVGWIALFGIYHTLLAAVAPPTIEVGPRRTVLGPRGLTWYSRVVLGASIPTAELVEVVCTAHPGPEPASGDLVLYGRERGISMMMEQLDAESRVWIARVVEHSIATSATVSSC